MTAFRTLPVFLTSMALTGCPTSTEVGLEDTGGSAAPDTGATSNPGDAETAIAEDGSIIVPPTDSGVIEDARPMLDAQAPDAQAEDAQAPAADVGYAGTLDDWCTGQPPEFSFFVTSMSALWTLSGDPIDDLSGGFGGDFGGIEGADTLCQTIAAATGHGDKTWRAFLSATNDGSGQPVHAIERIGEGPWYDANGRLVASGLQGLLGDDRPDGDPRSVDDLPDECGVPLTALGDAHDVLTGSNQQGGLDSIDPETTCLDWTSADGSVGSSGGGGPGPGGRTGRVMIGHSFPRGFGGGGARGGANWLSDHPTRGCAPGATLIQNGAGSGDCVGCSGGYGAIYCFALSSGGI